MSIKLKKRTRLITYCAILSALSVTILLLGSMLSLFDITAAAIASFAVVFMVCESGRLSALSVYLVTSLLSFILYPQGYATIMYVGFFGFYPIIKSLCETKIKSRPICIWVKFICFAVAYAVELILSVKLFGAENYAEYYIVAVIVLGIMAFFVYDITLSRLIVFYFRKIRKRLNIKQLFK